MTTATPAARRAEYYKAKAPAGATVEVTREESKYSPGFEIVQVTIRGGVDTICITIGGKATGRPRVSASSWFNSHGGKPRTIRVRDLPYRIRNLFI